MPAKAKKGRTAFNTAVADFLNAPDIDTIDLSGYTGQPGDLIRITVTDDYKVQEVKCFNNMLLMKENNISKQTA
jgi:hypothetical protein